MQLYAVAYRSHGVLAYAEVQISARVIECAVVAQSFEIGLGGRGKVRRTAHEIGHALLHQKTLQIKCFHDFELFDGVSQCEYEANCFAADYLLEDEDVLEMLNADMSFFQAAAELKVPPELLDFKFRMMKRSGVQIVDSPITSNSDFLKDIPTSGIIENY